MGLFFPLSPWKQQSRCSLSESRTSINKFSPRLWPLSSKSLVRSSYPNGLTLSRLTLPKNWLHMMRIGTTPDWHPWPDTFTLGLPSVFPQFARCMEFVVTTVVPHHIGALAPEVLPVKASRIWNNLNWWKRTLKVDGIWTVLLPKLSQSKKNKTNTSRSKMLCIRVDKRLCNNLKYKVKKKPKNQPRTFSESVARDTCILFWLRVIFLIFQAFFIFK